MVYCYSSHPVLLDKEKERSSEAAIFVYLSDSPHHRITMGPSGQSYYIYDYDQQFHFQFFELF